MGGHGLHVGGCADEADEPRKTCGSHRHEYLELRTADREFCEEARQLNETHAEEMGSNDPESHDDDSPGALGDADWNDGA